MKDYIEFLKDKMAISHQTGFEVKADELTPYLYPPSLALGASQWQTIYKVVIPYSISGITSGVVLGIGRAVGE